MRAGIFIPNGIVGEYDGWDARKAWERSIAVGRLSEELGFDSVWTPDHMQNIRQHNDAPSFESVMHLMALAENTQRVTLASGVACNGFRNPALLLKMMTTLDVASNGRAEIAIGAGWNAWEWNGYGWGFPPTKVRLQMLAEGLEVITRMLQPGRATWQGEHYRLEDAICEPKGLHRMPIIIGGNGQNVTWRLAAKYADELNFDSPSIEDVENWIPIARQRCEEIGRDPASLALSALYWWKDVSGQQRVEVLQRLAELGLTRIQSDIKGSTDSDEPLIAFAEDCRSAGVEMLA